MSDNYIYSEDELPAVPSRLARALKGIILAAAALLAAELVWLFLIGPCMPLSRIEVSGIPGLDRNLILAQAGIDGRTSYVSVNPRTVENALSLLPRVESVRVEKHLPGSVGIFLTGRKPLAASLARIGNRQGLVIFDRQGVVFGFGEAGDAGTVSLPLISGLIFEDPRPGNRLPPLFNAFLSRLDLIHESAPELLAAISEIRINRKNFEGFDLTLYPLHSPVRILAEADLNENMLRYMLLMVDVLVSRDPRIGEIDFRAGMASYTVKEASSG